jgi:hypothetical protein
MGLQADRTARHVSRCPNGLLGGLRLDRGSVSTPCSSNRTCRAPASDSRIRPRLRPDHVVPKPTQAYEPEVPVEVREWIPADAAGQTAGIDPKPAQNTLESSRAVARQAAALHGRGFDAAIRCRQELRRRSVIKAIETLTSTLSAREITSPVRMRTNS